MKQKKSLRALILLLIVAVNIGLDQVSKVIVRNQVQEHSYTEIIGDYFTLTRVENTGAFLSLGASASPWIRYTLLIGLPILTLLGMLIYTIVKKDMDKITSICMATVVGGGIGNIYDRILYGSVTDFLHIKIGAFQTGIFNMADVSVMVGVIVLLLYSFFARKKPAAE